MIGRGNGNDACCIQSFTREQELVQCLGGVDVVALEELDVPIGIISDNYGGSAAESWMSEAALADYPHYLDVAKRYADEGYLEDLAERTNLSASTISRAETGKRTISLDVLIPLAQALEVELDVLLDVRSDDDVVIRPTPRTSHGHTTWMLSRPTGSTIAMKMRIEPARRPPEQRVHPGRDWLFVLDGRVRLHLGDREITVETGEAAEFATMTPHAVAALDGPAEVIMIFDRDGQRAHVHRADA